jgi:pilus assembly protein CpaC
LIRKLHLALPFLFVAGLAAAEPAAPDNGAVEPPPVASAPRPRVIPLDIATPPDGPDATPAPGGRQVVPLEVKRPNHRPFVPQSAADVPVGEVVTVAVNKSRPLDLPAAVRDVVVGDPTIADVLIRAPRQVFLMGRKIGNTNAFFLGQNGDLVRRAEIHVGPDADSAQAAIAQLLPDEDIQVMTVGDALFLTGKARSDRAVNTAKTIARRFVAADANLINNVTVVGAQQVMLRVRVAEMDRNAVKQLGMRTFFTQSGKQVNLITNGGNAQGVDAGGIGAANPNYTFPVTGGSAAQYTTTITNGVATTTVTPGTAPQQTQPLFGALPGATSTYLGGGEYSTLSGNNPGSWLSVTPWNMLVNFAALEQEGLARTLAEPVLTTVSGEAARFLAGGEIPIPTASTLGVVTVEWKPFGVGLVFSPVILSNGNISLKLESEVSSIDKSITVSTGSVTVPGFKTRRATTVVEVPSGGSLMIAGLLQNDDSTAINSVPGLREVPVLGTLFGSSAFQRDETELVVTVVAYLVDPVDGKSLAMPTDGFVPASDLKRYFLLHLQENYVGKKVDLPPTALKGPVGYIVE